MRNLINKKKLNIIGLNSGTSADSLDLALVRMGEKSAPQFIEGKTVRLPEKLKEKIFKLADSNDFQLEEYIYLDNYLGHFIGKAAAKYITDLKSRNKTVDLIGSHGQTIRHLPQKLKYLDRNINGTLQIGSPEFIAAQTGKVVVADFRQADIALGNEGAPITSNALRYLINDNKNSYLIVNIGGMSNYFLFSKDKKQPIRSADCGPGNVLCDLLAQKLFAKPYDKNGSFARKGNVSKRLLSILMADPFFKGKTRSTGREAFGLKLAEKIISFKNQLKLTNYDLLATAAELTIWSINRTINPLIEQNKEIKKLYLTGGGRKNIFLKNGLKQSPLDIGLIDDLGIDGDYTEAACYAILGGASLWSQNLEVSSDKKRPLLGKIIQPPK